jgi:hypothetical protein
MDRREAIKRTALITGYALSASAITAVLQGCQPATKADQVAQWEPVFFSKEQGVALAEIGERVLPRTDTPGAKDVYVHEFIDQIAHQCMELEEQERLKAGYVQLLADCQQKNGKPFTECSQDEQLAFLNEQDQLARKYVEANPGLDEEAYPAWLSLKQLILLGYFTSEKVGTEVLAYLPIPGTNEPCIPYEAGTPAWSL